jgi:hypothetical protein
VSLSDLVLVCAILGACLAFWFFVVVALTA